MDWRDKIVFFIMVISFIVLIGLIVWALNIPPAESVYIPRSELKELF